MSHARPFWLFAVSCSLASHAIALPQDMSGLPDSSSPMADSNSQWGAPLVIPPYFTQIRIAHASLASIAWLFFFPLGAILIRTVETGSDYGDVRIHAFVQMLGCAVFVAAAGMGIWMAKLLHVLDSYHPILGMVLLACLALQPLTEMLNARFFQRYPRMIYLAHVHIWFGRLLITAGIIQGGLGFVFTASFPMSTPEPGPRIAYGVAAVIVWILYVSLAIIWPEVKHSFAWWRRRQNRVTEEQEGLRIRSLTDLAAPSAVEGSAGRRK